MSADTTDPRAQAMIEAGARAVATSNWRRVPWSDLDHQERQWCYDTARACPTAAFAAVPGVVLTEAGGELPDFPNGYVSDQFGKGWNAHRAATLAKVVTL